MAEHSDEESDFSDEFDFEYGGAPYMFEPEYTDEELREMDEHRLLEQELALQQEEAPQRIHDENLDWCRCGKKCTRMRLNEECVCCKEFYLWRREQDSDSEGDEDDQISPCITNADAFAPMINRGVLQTVFHAKNGPKPEPAGPDGQVSNDQCRLVAYEFCLEWLLRGESVAKGTILPSCMVAAIRRAYPSEDGQ